MAKDKDEYNDIRKDSAVADLLGHRHGRVLVVIGKGMFRVRWEDGEDQIVDRDQILVRYTTESRKFVPAKP